MLITLYQENIKENLLDYVVSTLEKDGIAIIPTDTLYTFVCDIKSNKAAHRLAQLKGKQLEKSNFSILCENLSMASQYVKQLSNEQFSFIKDLDTGGFTFVLPSSNLTPKIFQSKKRTIGIRIPQNTIPLSIISRLSRPLLVSSLPTQDKQEEDYSNAELIYEQYKNLVDVVVDSDGISNVPSTVVNMLTDDFIVEREGLGKLNE
jgi:tRNA threonylcarbamoyl adenosine modification protein (Sua5/YciO/YrdC/YwlC family)